jgi:dolichol-phosphate mannosyltransferase
LAESAEGERMGTTHRSAAAPLTTAALRLGIVTPMANEEATAVEFVDRVLEACACFSFASVTLFAVLDNVSRDGTHALLEAKARAQPELRVIWAPECRGVADAYVRGYREALAAGCDWILEIDAGFSHDPGEIGTLLAAMPGNDCVFGSRFARGAANLGTPWRRTVSRGGTLLTNLVLGTHLTDMTGGFELFTHEALEHVLDRGIRSRGPFFQTEIKVHCRDLKIAEVPIHYDSSSHVVGGRAIGEALANLGRLAGLRLAGSM